MAKKSTRATGQETINTLGQDFQATRAVWNEGVEAMSPTAEELIARLTQLGKALYDSPLGKRAQRNPVGAVGIASLALVVCRKLFRR